MVDICAARVDYALRTQFIDVFYLPKITGESQSWAQLNALELIDTLWSE